LLKHEMVSRKYTEQDFTDRRIPRSSLCCSKQFVFDSICDHKNFDGLCASRKPRRTSINKTSRFKESNLVTSENLRNDIGFVRLFSIEVRSLLKSGFFSYHALEKSCNGQGAHDIVEEINSDINGRPNIARKVSLPQNKVLTKKRSSRLRHPMLARDGTDKSTAGMVSRSGRKSIVLNRYSISTHEKQNSFIDVGIHEKDNPFYSDCIPKDFERLGSKSQRARAFARLRSISPRAKAANSRALNQASPTISRRCNRRVASQAFPTISRRVASQASPTTSRRVSSQASPTTSRRILRAPSPPCREKAANSRELSQATITLGGRFVRASSPPLNICSNRKIDDTSLIQHLLYAGE